MGHLNILFYELTTCIIQAFFFLGVLFLEDL